MKPAHSNQKHCIHRAHPRRQDLQLLRENTILLFLRTFPHVTALHITTPIFFPPHHGKSGIFVVGVEVTQATVETDMRGNDFH